MDLLNHWSIMSVASGSLVSVKYSLLSLSYSFCNHSLTPLASTFSGTLIWIMSTVFVLLSLELLGFVYHEVKRYKEVTGPMESTATTGKQAPKIRNSLEIHYSLSLETKPFNSLWEGTKTLFMFPFEDSVDELP